jgi:(p)ppGpp synthase/HD superfamily hydrolase
MLRMAAIGHEGQFDEKGNPYIYHPLYVMNSMPEDDINGRIVAIGHDLMEDSGFIADNFIAAGFSLDIVAALIAISKVKGESYDSYLERVKANKLATRVKLKDAGHNHERSFQELIYAIAEDNDIEAEKKAEKRVNKYRKALNYLEGS